MARGRRWYADRARRIPKRFRGVPVDVLQAGSVARPLFEWHANVRTRLIDPPGLIGGVSIGTDFDHMVLASLRNPGETELTPVELYSGIFKDTIGDESSYDSKLAWETTRPYPTNVAAAANFLKVEAS